MRSILDILFPPRCAGCDEMIPEGSFCGDCMKKICREPWCFCLQTRQTPGIKPEHPVFCAAVFTYEGLLRQAILDFKFSGRKSLAEYFSEELYQLAQNQYDSVCFDVVTCIPMHKERLAERGYNQSELLAVKLGKLMGLTIEKRALIPKRGILQQHTLSFSERRTNMKDAYRADRDVSGKTVLLCDDIVTSGSTLLEGAETLLRAGAKEVFCIGIAATGGTI